MSVLLCLAVPLTCLLFFFRACAVFGMKPLAAAIYGVLWLGVLGGCLTTIPGSSDANIGPTPYCAYETFRLYSAAATITPLINDGIVFFAISWRLWSNTWTRRTVKNGVRVLVFGDYLPAFSRLLLQDGQIYFLSVFLILSATLVNSIFPQDHGRCQSFSSGHGIFYFCPQSLPSGVLGSQRRIGEYYGMSSLSKDGVARFQAATEFFGFQSNGQGEPNYRQFNGQFDYNGRDYGVMVVLISLM